MNRRFAAGRAAAFVFLLFLPLLVFHGPLLRGEAFVPADLLGHLAPWSAARSSPPPVAWNVLRFDGITQFYPWRLQAARTVRAGRIPLWNPYQFGAEGGTPLLANSQSAPLYPPQVLFYLTPPERFVYAFGLSAALHLLLAAVGTYRLARAAVHASRFAALLAAATFTLSGPVTAWLALPTFLAVSCWFPWVLLLVHHAFAFAQRGDPRWRLAALGGGMTAGLMLLAGHLQIAFYGLFAAMLYGLWLGVTSPPAPLRSGGGRKRERGDSIAPSAFTPLSASEGGRGGGKGRWLLPLMAAGLLALFVAAPQLLPSIELSRVSHRAGRPSWGNYQAYSHAALPPRNLVTLLAPDFFGHPNRGNYWNGSPTTGNNYGEWAAYVGVLPLLLSVFAVACLPWRRGKSELLNPKQGLFWTALGLLTLLMAMGTPVNLPLFFGVPGWGQTGNPGRVLVLSALCFALLAAVGLDKLLESGETNQKRRAAFVAVVLPVLVAALGASAAARYAGETLPQVPFGDLLRSTEPGLQMALALVVVSAGLLTAPLWFTRFRSEYRSAFAVLCLLLTVADLYAWGAGYNPTSPPDRVYPVTPGIAWLQKNAPNALIAPLNARWSLSPAPPIGAALPPNALTVYGLHDIAGYDSLFPGRAKERVREAGQGMDPSPPENGNIVFVKSAGAAIQLGARYLVAAPDAPQQSAAADALGLRRAYDGSDLTIWENPAGRDWQAPPPTAYPATTFRVGLFLGLCALATGAAALTTASLTRRRVS